VLLAHPQIDIVQVEQEGKHHLVLLNSGAATILSDEEVLTRVRTFPGQPKAASLLVAADAAARGAEQGAAGIARFACCVVAVFTVSPDGSSCGSKGANSGTAEPPAKRPRAVAAADKAADKAGEKVRARHILLKHAELKIKIDPKAHLRQKGPVTRPLAQAERELLRLKQLLAKDSSQFPTLARKHSECQSALKGGEFSGDLGWLDRKSEKKSDEKQQGQARNLKPQLPSNILKVAFELNIGELGDILTSEQGVHLVQRTA